jgi:hypothetical protein
MSEPKIADRKPIKVELKKGEEQYLCAGIGEVLGPVGKG